MPRMGARFGGRADLLFSLDYTREVFAHIAAPAKGLVVFDTDHHLLFNECLPLVQPRVAELISGLDAQQPGGMRTAFPSR